MACEAPKHRSEAVPAGLTSSQNGNAAIYERRYSRFQHTQKPTHVYAFLSGGDLFHSIISSRLTVDVPVRPRRQCRGAWATMPMSKCGNVEAQARRCRGTSRQYRCVGVAMPTEAPLSRRLRDAGASPRRLRDVGALPRRPHFASTSPAARA